MSEHHTGRCRRFAAVVCGLVLTAGLASCSENPEPQPLEDTTAAANSTPSPTPSRSPNGAPTMPPEAKGTSKQAAIAFVEHVIEVLNYTAQSLNTQVFQRISASNCEACARITDSMREIRSSGGFISGGAWTPVEIRAYMGAGSGLVQVQAVVDSAHQVVRRSENGKCINHPAGRRVYLFNIAPGRTGWELTAIEAGSP